MVKGLRGKVAMHTELVVRFEYGSVVPWVSRREDGRREITAGPDRLLLAAYIPFRGERFLSLRNDVGFWLKSTAPPIIDNGESFRRPSLTSRLSTRPIIWRGRMAPCINAPNNRDQASIRIAPRPYKAKAYGWNFPGPPALSGIEPGLGSSWMAVFGMSRQQ